MTNKQKLIDLFFSIKGKAVEQSILFQIEKENKKELTKDFIKCADNAFSAGIIKKIKEMKRDEI